MSNAIAVGFKSETFEIKSPKFPSNMHVPHYKAASADLLSGASRVVDGELVLLDGGNVLKKVTSAMLDEMDNQALLYPARLQPGRSDVQMAGGFPIYRDTDFHAWTRLIDYNDIASYTPGTYLKAGVVTTPKAGTCGYVPAEPGDEYLAVVETGATPFGENQTWIEIHFRRGTIPAAAS